MDATSVEEASLADEGKGLLRGVLGGHIYRLLRKGRSITLHSDPVCVSGFHSTHRVVVVWSVAAVRPPPPPFPPAFCCWLFSLQARPRGS